MVVNQITVTSKKKGVSLSLTTSSQGLQPWLELGERKGVGDKLYKIGLGTSGTK